MQSPKFILLKGKGRFLLGDSTVKSTFVLFRNPYRIGITSKGKPLCNAAFHPFPTSATVQLSGTLNDGRIVNAGGLLVTKSQIGSNSCVEFIANEGVCLGQQRDIPPTESRFPLTGYFDGKFALVYDGWDISTIPCPSPETAQILAKNWRCPVEGMVLQLRRENSTMDQHRSLARDVMVLLSLASGTGVSCDRHFFKWENEELEIWRHMTGDEIGPGPIVPEFEVSRFLEQTLPAWQTMAKNQRKALGLAIYDINQSALGYLDKRLFHIFRPWEYLAEAWGMHGEMSNSVTCLHSRLQQARKQWERDFPHSDSHGFWGSRISSIFKQPNLRDAIERLALSFNLDFEQVGFDLSSLKKARDSVAHSGKLPENFSGPDRQAIDLLSIAQYCLQLLLLRMLAFQGRVYHATSGWRTIVDINKALITVRGWRKT